ncbi:MAG: PAS domain S-box protein, partial [Flavobacteriaceae bacterium]|nr:PAS domain S-box protein [Flavobacteriaceae bacterium]
MGEFDKKTNHFFGILFEAVSEGIIVVNMQREIVACNTSAYDLFGYENEALIGQPLQTLIPQKYHHNHGDHFNGYVKNSGKRQMGKGRDLYGQHKNGTNFPVEVGLNPFEIENEKFVFAIIIDISVRKEQESQILELNTHLEQKISIRTQELNEKVAQLKKEISKRKVAENKIKESLREERELNELKTKFLSLVSHEFKTPLSGILTSVILAGKYTKTEQQEKREKHLNIIQNKVKYLNNILNDFLSIERLETGKVNYLFNTFPLSKV